MFKLNKINNKTKILTCIVSIFLMSIMFVGCAGEITYNLVKYTNAKDMFENEINDNMDLLSNKEISDSNVDRGFRGETYLTLGSNVAYPSSTENAYTKLDKEIKLYSDDGVKIMQLYVYLIEFYNKDLTTESLSQLTKYFEYLKTKEIRILLRFAYEYNADDNVGPKTKQILKHTEQLGEWFKVNKELVDDVVYSTQIGIIGLWGEGHGGKYNHNLTTIITAVEKMVPDNLSIMLRTPEQLSEVPSGIENRFGLHEDFLVGQNHEWGMIDQNHVQYNDILAKCQRSLCDGEMPWGKDTTVPKIDHLLLIKQVANFGLNTMSITHNYKENGGSYHLDKWKNIFVTKSELIANKLPYNIGSLKDDKISVYNYLAWHLGYNIGVSNLSETKDGISILLSNFGMAAPYGYNMDVIVNGELQCSINDLNSLIQFEQKFVNIQCKKGDKIGIRISNKNSKKTIRLSNGLEYLNGINYINF